MIIIIIIKIPEIIKEGARDLRNNMTKAEIILWNILKKDNFGLRFLRQKPVYVYTENSGLDRFIIADFYCPEKKIVIEVDGSVHDLDEIIILDNEKEKILNKKGITVYRIKNNEIFSNLEKVLDKIKQNIS